MDQVTIGEVARALVALEEEEGKLRQEQLELANQQYQLWLRLGAVIDAKANLWRNSRGNSAVPVSTCGQYRGERHETN